MKKLFALIIVTLILFFSIIFYVFTISNPAFADSEFKKQGGAWVQGEYNPIPEPSKLLLTGVGVATIAALRTWRL